jgi:hypothetical protein
MTTHTGDEGVVLEGANQVAEVRSFSITEEIGIIPDTAKGDTADTHKSGRKRWFGTISCWWDQDDTAQGNMQPGDSITIKVYPEGNTSGDIELTGTCTIESVTESSPEGESIAEVEIAFRGTGALTRGTVV